MTTNFDSQDDHPIVINDSVIHGVQCLILARNQRRSAIFVHVLCGCGRCVTTEDITSHYSLIFLAAQMPSNATVPKDLVRYMHAREKEAQVNEWANAQRVHTERRIGELNDNSAACIATVNNMTTRTKFTNVVGSSGVDRNGLRNRTVRFFSADVTSWHGDDQSQVGVIEVRGGSGTGNVAGQCILNFDFNLERNVSMGIAPRPDVDLDANDDISFSGHLGAGMSRSDIIDMDSDDLSWIETTDAVRRRHDRVHTSSINAVALSIPSSSASDGSTYSKKTLCGRLRQSQHNRQKHQGNNRLWTRITNRAKNLWSRLQQAHDNRRQRI